MAAIGYDYDAMLAERVDLLYAESHCNYTSRVKWPEVLRIHTHIAELGRRSVRGVGRYEFDIRAEQDGRQVAAGHISAITAERGTWAFP
jgi:acyl-CoA thioesterase FadM